MRVLALAALVTLVVGLGIGLLRARWFFITDVQIAGAIFVDEAPLREVVWRELERPAMLLSQRAHRWFFDPDALQKILLGVAPLQSVEILNEGNRLTVRLTERPSRILFEAQDGFWLLDEEGRALQPLEEHELLEDPYVLLPRVSSIKKFPVQRSETEVIPPDVIKEILGLYERIEGHPFVVVKAQIDTETWHLLELALEDGYKIYLDPTEDLSEQIDRVITVLQSESKHPSAFEYIDVRFGDRVFIKEK